MTNEYEDPFQGALAHFLRLWKLQIVTQTFDSRRFRDPLDHALNKRMYAAGKSNAIYLVREKKLFSSNPFWVLRISKEPMLCTRVKNDIRLHKDLANHGIALGFKAANVRPYNSEVCYQAMLLPYANHTLASFLSGSPSLKEIQAVANRVDRLISSIASKGYLLDDILPQNIVLVKDKVFVIDIESSEVEEELRPENQHGYAKEMMEQVIASLPRTNKAVEFRKQVLARLNHH